jgi:hypothetical protein
LFTPFVEGQHVSHERGRGLSIMGLSPSANDWSSKGGCNLVQWQVGEVLISDVLGGLLSIGTVVLSRGSRQRAAEM